MNNNHNNHDNRNTLMEKIRALAFVKTETELFLDTHPDSAAALAYYRDTVRRLEELMEEYTDKYGPITASHSVEGGWSWISGPWPWQRETDKNTKGDM